MKKALALFASLLLAITSLAGEITVSDVPAKVKACVDSVFPKIEVVRWELEKGRYEAWVKKKDHQIAVSVLPDGHVFAMLKRIKANELPKTTQEFIKKTAKLEEVKEAEEILYTRVNRTFYMAKYKGYKYNFDDKGNFMSKEDGSGSGSGAKETQAPEPVKAKPLMAPAKKNN